MTTMADQLAIAETAERRLVSRSGRSSIDVPCPLAASDGYLPGPTANSRYRLTECVLRPTRDSHIA